MRGERQQETSGGAADAESAMRAAAAESASLGEAGPAPAEAAKRAFSTHMARRLAAPEDRLPLSGAVAARAPRISQLVASIALHGQDARNAFSAMAEDLRRAARENLGPAEGARRDLRRDDEPAEGSVQGAADGSERDAALAAFFKEDVDAPFDRIWIQEASPRQDEAAPEGPSQDRLEPKAASTASAAAQDERAARSKENATDGQAAPTKARTVASQSASAPRRRSATALREDAGAKAAFETLERMRLEAAEAKRAQADVADADPAKPEPAAGAAASEQSVGAASENAPKTAQGTEQGTGQSRAQTTAALKTPTLEASKASGGELRETLQLSAEAVVHRPGPQTEADPSAPPPSWWRRWRMFGGAMCFLIILSALVGHGSDGSRAPTASSPTQSAPAWPPKSTERALLDDAVRIAGLIEGVDGDFRALLEPLVGEAAPDGPSRGLAVFQTLDGACAAYPVELLVDGSSQTGPRASATGFGAPTPVACPTAAPVDAVALVAAVADPAGDAAATLATAPDEISTGALRRPLTGAELTALLRLQPVKCVTPRFDIGAACAERTYYNTVTGEAATLTPLGAEARLDPFESGPRVEAVRRFRIGDDGLCVAGRSHRVRALGLDPTSRPAVDAVERLRRSEQNDDGAAEICHRVRRLARDAEGRTLFVAEAFVRGAPSLRHSDPRVFALVAQ